MFWNSGRRSEIVAAIAHIYRPDLHHIESRSSFVNSADEENEDFYIIWGYWKFLPTPALKGHKNMDKTNYAETTLGYNNRNKANFVSKWFFWYLNPTFTKGSKDRGRNGHRNK